jgi:hypothetical protein
MLVLMTTKPVQVLYPLMSAIINMLPAISPVMIFIPIFSAFCFFIQSVSELDKKPRSTIRDMMDVISMVVLGGIFGYFWMITIPFWLIHRLLTSKKYLERR